MRTHIGRPPSGSVGVIVYSCTAASHAFPAYCQRFHFFPFAFPIVLSAGSPAVGGPLLNCSARHRAPGPGRKAKMLLGAARRHLESPPEASRPRGNSPSAWTSLGRPSAPGCLNGVSGFRLPSSNFHFVRFAGWPDGSAEADALRAVSGPLAASVSVLGGFVHNNPEAQDRSGGA
jgi:hypothetical protein